MKTHAFILFLNSDIYFYIRDSKQNTFCDTSLQMSKRRYVLMLHIYICYISEWMNVTHLRESMLKRYNIKIYRSHYHFNPENVILYNCNCNHIIPYSLDLCVVSVNRGLVYLFPVFMILLAEIGSSYPLFSDFMGLLSVGIFLISWFMGLLADRGSAYPLFPGLWAF